MAVETNVVTSADIAKVNSIDFVEQFGGQVSKMLEVLGVVRKIPLASGSTVKVYPWVVSMAEDNAVEEGEIIPLSKVEMGAPELKEVILEKYRKAVTAEAIQRSGYDTAVAEADGKLVKQITKGVRAGLFELLETTESIVNGAQTLQAAIAKAWAGVQTAFEDDEANVVAFANPNDVADYLGEANITTQEAFGMKYLTSFSNIDVLFISSLVPAGKVYATAVENLVMAYIDVNGELAKAFDLTHDESGYIGVIHDVTSNRAQVETIAMTGVMFFPEIVNGVICATIGVEDETAEV